MYTGRHCFICWKDINFSSSSIPVNLQRKEILETQIKVHSICKSIPIIVCWYYVIINNVPWYKAGRHNYSWSILCSSSSIPVNLQGKEILKNQSTARWIQFTKRMPIIVCRNYVINNVSWCKALQSQLNWAIRAIREWMPYIIHIAGELKSYIMSVYIKMSSYCEYHAWTTKIYLLHYRIVQVDSDEHVLATHRSPSRTWKCDESIMI